jgi:hypothetical protein
VSAKTRHSTPFNTPRQRNKFTAIEGTMKRARLATLLFACLGTVASAETIPAAEASKHIGEQGTVCGQIASEHEAIGSRGKPTFINLDKPYPDQVFTALVWGSDRERVGRIPSSGRLCVTGLITDYKGVPEIIVRDARSWYVPQ